MTWKQSLYRTLGGILVVAVVVSAGTYLVSRPNPNRAIAEQYAIYSAYIESGLTGDSHSLGDRRGTVLIAAESTMVAELGWLQRWRFMVASLLNLRRRPTPPRNALVYRLFIANLKPHKFDRRFGISAEYALLDSAALSNPNINMRFPGSYGYLTFSSVAFNPDLSDALFYTEHMCGLCGGGEYVLMRKIHGTWIIVSH